MQHYIILGTDPTHRWRLQENADPAKLLRDVRDRRKDWVPVPVFDGDTPITLNVNPAMVTAVALVNVPEPEPFYSF